MKSKKENLEKMVQKEVKNLKEIQSPSSINLYKQCPRKYFHKYIEGLEIKPNIYTVVGSIVHNVLENFFKIDICKISNETYNEELRIIIKEFAKKEWASSLDELIKLGLNNIQMQFYYVDVVKMVESWYSDFSKRLEEETEKKGLEKGFRNLKPRTEVKYSSDKLKVMGFIDAIHEGEEVVLLDYKTSSKNDFKKEYLLQLGIYALLYEEKHGKRPDKVGIDFLRFGRRIIEVNDELIEKARITIKEVYEKTRSADIKNYPKNVNPLCKWYSGQCEFYNLCFKE